MRISDWSSDVCSSDLSIPPLEGRAPLDVLGSDLRRGAIAGATLKFRDSRASARFADTTIPPLGIISGGGVPLLREGRFAGGFYVTQASPRVWPPGEIGRASGRARGGQ